MQTPRLGPTVARYPAIEIVVWGLAILALIAVVYVAILSVMVVVALSAID